MTGWIALAVSTILGVAGSWFANHLPVSESFKEQILVVCLIAVFVTLLGMNAKRLLAYTRLYTVAKLRGLWGGDPLHASIARDYSRASCIDIKVTRGFGLFLKADGLFKRLILETKSPATRKIRILLHYPCLESDHLRRRAKANHKNLDEYVDDLFLVLKTLYTHSDDPNTGETITVRFYISDKDSEWRFYVIEGEHGNRTLYFNHYDDSMSGAKSRMLKVVEGNHSLCDELKQTFDDLFQNASFEVVENHSSPRLLNSDRCGHPACEQRIQASFVKHFKS